MEFGYIDYKIPGFMGLFRAASLFIFQNKLLISSFQLAVSKSVACQFIIIRVVSKLVLFPPCDIPIHLSSAAMTIMMMVLMYFF